MPLNKPTPGYVRKRLAQEYAEDLYFGADPAVRLVFNQWPLNERRPEVLAKVTILNALYSTNIFNVYPVVDRILSLRLDPRLSDGDETLVDDVAKVTLGTKPKVLLSFASKYCAWHQPNHFQIFDSRVEWILWEYQKKHAFAIFSRYELRHYPTFARVLEEFKVYFNLVELTRKEIDKFLWIEAGP